MTGPWKRKRKPRLALRSLQTAMSSPCMHLAEFATRGIASGSASPMAAGLVFWVPDTHRHSAWLVEITALCLCLLWKHIFIRERADTELVPLWLSCSLSLHLDCGGHLVLDYTYFQVHVLCLYPSVANPQRHCILGIAKCRRCGNYCLSNFANHRILQFIGYLHMDAAYVRQSMTLGIACSVNGLKVS